MEFNFEMIMSKACGAEETNPFQMICKKLFLKHFLS